MTRKQRHNAKFRCLLLEHLGGCEQCKVPPTKCVLGRRLWNLVGRTDEIRSPEYQGPFRIDCVADDVFLDALKVMRFRPTRKFGYVGFNSKSQ